MIVEEEILHMTRRAEEAMREWMRMTPTELADDVVTDLGARHHSALWSYN